MARRNKPGDKVWYAKRTQDEPVQAVIVSTHPDGLFKLYRIRTAAGGVKVVAEQEIWPCLLK